ncbi:ABC transporter substrate-binding protein [Streptomyces sp. NPDC058424]|uniref:ABC transporter substrate-binding protein n=1 Tax=Streptomyces sp. NPDC058424 TaxID=3346491 RepID=UPI00364FB91F
MLGATSPLTGVPAASCARVDNGALSWFKHINDEGGVNGRRITWKILDDAYDLSRAGANARKLVDGDYFAIFGGCGSIQPPAIVPVAARAKVPYLFPMAQVPDLYLPTNPYTYAFSPSWASMFHGVIPWALKEKGIGSVAVVFAENAGIDKSVQAVKSATVEAGGTYAGEQVAPAATSDWTPIILKLKQQKPDYVVLNLSVEVALKFQQAAEDQGFEPKKSYINAISLMGDAYVRALKTGPNSTKLDGKVISAYQVATPDDPANAECVAATKKYAPDFAPDGNLMAGCNSARWMVEALKRTGKDLTRENFMKTLGRISDDQLSPGAVPASFSADDHLGPDSMYVYELEGGKYVKKGTVPLDSSM